MVEAQLRLGRVEGWTEQLLGLGELSDEPIEYRIPGLLLTNGNILLSAYRKTGKTTLMMHPAAALTGRRNFLGLECAPVDGKVVYAGFDMDQSMLRKYAVDQGVSADSDRFSVLDYRGRASRFRLADDEWRWRFADMLYKEQADVLIVDPIHPVLVTSGAGVRPENDETRATLELLGEIARDAGLSHLILVDAAGHSDQARSRGASAKEDWADVLWNLRREEDATTLTAREITARSGQPRPHPRAPRPPTPIAAAKNEWT